MPSGIYIRTYKRKMPPMSEETKRKIGLANSIALKNNKFINSGQFKKGRKFSHSEETKKKISDSQKGEKSYNWGKVPSEKTRKKQSLVKLGNKTHLWKGGITPLNTLIRQGLKYRLWRKSVFERDNYICQLCGQKGNELNADHIKPFSLFPELRFILENGRTLCLECHKKTDTWGRPSISFKKNRL